MITEVRNNTDKTIKVSFNNNNICIPPYKSDKLTFIDSTVIEINNVNNEKPFLQRIKEEISINSIDLAHLKFEIKYFSYLKTNVTVGQINNKKQIIEICDDLYIENSILKLRCLTAKSTKLNDNKYKCVNRIHKLALCFSCLFALLVKYGIIGIAGLLFCVGSLADINNIKNNEYEDIIFVIIAAFVFITFFIVFIIRLIQFVKIAIKI